MVEIILNRNQGYPWSRDGQWDFKGYFLLGGEKYEGDAAVDLLNHIKAYDDFIVFLKKIDGIYSIIFHSNNELWAAVDIARTHALYFDIDGRAISDNSEDLRKHLNIPKEKTDDVGLLSLFMADFVPFNDTTYSKIRQLSLGQALRIRDGAYSIEFYYIHTADVINITRNQALERFKELSSTVFDNLVKAIDGRPVVLSLSGGYDSRYIAFMLKEKGITDVLCYTYGKATSFEVDISKDVAEKLGFEWYLVEYSDAEIKDFFSEENVPYIAAATQHDYILYIQNYFAMKKLSTSGLVKPGTVFLTGLCGDMPTGEYVLADNIYETVGLNNQAVATLFVDSVYHSNRLSEEVKRIYVEKALAQLECAGLSADSVQSFITCYDFLDTMSCHSRCFLIANFNHEYFGYEYLLPLWDKSWLSFWYSMRREYRVHQNLYEEVVVDILGKKYNIRHKKEPSSFLPWGLLKLKKSVKIKYFLGGMMAHILYPLGITIRRSKDINNMMAISTQLYKKIVAKDMIYYPKAGFMFMFKLYLLEQRYGSAALRRLKKYL